MNSTKSLHAFAGEWRDEPGAHEAVVNAFREAVNAYPDLKAHRDHIEQHTLGMGDRAFHWLWHLVFEDWRAHSKPWPFSFLEIGVFRGQAISAMRLLAQRANVPSEIVGVSTFDARNLYWGEIPAGYDDYPQVLRLFEDFRLEPPTLISGDSTAPETVEEVYSFGPYDAVYIDGSHEYPAVCADLRHYAPMVKPGGVLLMDDAATKLNLPKGFFYGFEGVARAVDDVLPTTGAWIHLGNVHHLRVWRQL